MTFIMADGRLDFLLRKRQNIRGKKTLGATAHESSPVRASPLLELEEEDDEGSRNPGKGSSGRGFLPGPLGVDCVGVSLLFNSRSSLSRSSGFLLPSFFSFDCWGNSFDPRYRYHCFFDGGSFFCCLKTGRTRGRLSRRLARAECPGAGVARKRPRKAGAA